MKNKSTNSNVLFGIVILALLLFSLSFIVNHHSQTVSAQSSNMTNIILPEIENQNESTIASQSSIIAVNLTGIVNQTDNTMIGFRPMDPAFCRNNPDSILCKPKTQPPVDNKCSRRPDLCDPCQDPTGICPQPRPEFEDHIKIKSSYNV
jgi:hypothetical protein